jgi:POT family proton-dependent oligopeptide transporter
LARSLQVQSTYPQQYYKTIVNSSSDQYVGKFKAITISLGVYIVGLAILVATATPAGIQSNAGFGGLVAAMVIIGLGTGGIKANVSPMCAEQYQNAEPVLKTLDTGEIVVVDP